MDPKQDDDDDEGEEDGTDPQATRLFVVCGRGRQPEELRRLFSACGALQSLHLALDRSGRSRGFAFLQYKEPASAREAIARFHQLRLDDGHVLKVTVAKDKPVVALGKLKRDQQQSSQEVQGDSDSTAGDDAHVSGKRQRSSPPPVSHDAATAAAASVSLEATPRRKVRVGTAADGGSALSFEAASGAVLPALSPSPPARPDNEVANALDDMLVAVQSAGDHPATLQTLVTGYTLIAEHRSRVRATATASSSSLSAAARGDGDRREETSTEQLTSSIHSFSLDAFPSAAAKPQAHRLSVLAPAFGGFVRANGASDRVARASLLRRRRESSDESDSSLDGASDASMSRRKRSNVGQREPSKWVARPDPDRAAAATTAGGERTQPSESPASSSASLAPPNKPCKRQSSDQSADAPARSSKQRVTTARSRHSVAPAPSTSLTPHLAAATIETERSRTKLFFISSRKFTMQELEAMFSVYGDFEAVNVVKSFGRIKTMAYVQYSNPRTATSVLESFQEETLLDTDLVASEFAKSPSLSLLPRTSIERDEEKLWLLLLYDRSLPSNLISMCASRCIGMLFVDIKVFRSTGKAQGVAFVKFESEDRAVEAAYELHKLELPTGSGKFMQAIVISDPSVFSTMHGGSHIGEHHSGGDGNEAGGGGDDVDLSAVEAKFAHLMRGSDQGSALSAVRPRIASEETAYTQYHQAWPHPLWTANSASPHHPTVCPPHQLQHNAQAYGYYPHQQLHQPHQYATYSPHSTHPFAYAPSHPQWTEFPSATSYFHPAHPSSSFVSTQMTGVPPPEYYAHAYPAPPVVGVEVPPSMLGTESNQDGATDTESLATATGGASSDGLHGTTPTSSIFVSSCRPLDLFAVARALDGCTGVDGITKDGEGSDAVYVVEFVDAAQASAAVEKLDGKTCGGKKLRVTTASGKGGKPRGVPSRRKRQRVDQRNRK